MLTLVNGGMLRISQSKEIVQSSTKAVKDTQRGLCDEVGRQELQKAQHGKGIEQKKKINPLPSAEIKVYLTEAKINHIKRKSNRGRKL